MSADSIALGGGIRYNGTLTRVLMPYVVEHADEVAALKAWLTPRRQKLYDDVGVWSLPLGLDDMLGLERIVDRFALSPPAIVAAWPPDAQERHRAALTEFQQKLAQRISDLRAGSPPGGDWTGPEL